MARDSYLEALKALDADYLAKRDESSKLESDFCAGKGVKNAEMNAAMFRLDDARSALREALWKAWPQIKADLSRPSGPSVPVESEALEACKAALLLISLTRIGGAPVYKAEFMCKLADDVLEKLRLGATDGGNK